MRKLLLPALISAASLSIATSALMIEAGDADVMVAGGAEAATRLNTVAGFGNARALGRAGAGGDPTKVCRPFDKGRSGFIMGEGAGALVLEAEEHAKARGAMELADRAGGDGRQVLTALEVACALAHPGTVGKAVPGADVRVIDEAGNSLKPHEIGEVIARFPEIADFTYHGDDEKRRASEKVGLIAPGDIGFFDEDGFLYLCDRAKDMIISGGFNVYPSEVEQVIWGHPAVQDCAVIGVPDEKWGEAVKAVVELNKGQTVSADDLIALCKEKLGSVKAPKSIDFIDVLPRSPIGKVLKKDLRARYWQDAARKI